MIEIVKWGFLLVSMTGDGWNLEIGELQDFRYVCEWKRTEKQLDLISELPGYDFWVSKECTQFKVSVSGDSGEADVLTDVWLKAIPERKPK